MNDDYVDFVEIYETADGFRWRAKADNGRVLFTGESHPEYSGAEKAAKNATRPDVEIRRVVE